MRPGPLRFRKTVNGLAQIWQRHPGLVWSNPAAGDSVRLRAALLHPRFDRLLELALEFGEDRLRAEWEFLFGERTRDVERARFPVERILRNIGTGFAHAARRH